MALSGTEIVLITGTDNLGRPSGTQEAVTTAAIAATGTGVVNGYTAQQYFAAQPLTDAASIAWNLNTAQAATLLMTSTVGATRVLANPTNLKNGGTYTLKITQSSTGSNALTYGNLYKWPSGSAPTLSTANNAVDIITFLSDGTNMYGVAQFAFS